MQVQRQSHCTTASKCHVITSLLIEAGAKVNVQNGKGFTPLMYAVISGNIQAVRLLIDAGAHIDIENGFGMNAMKMAMSSKRQDIINLLKDKGTPGD